MITYIFESNCGITYAFIIILQIYFFCGLQIKCHSLIFHISVKFTKLKILRNNRNTCFGTPFECLQYFSLLYVKIFNYL